MIITLWKYGIKKKEREKTLGMLALYLLSLIAMDGLLL